jgi:hypothetical protein
MNKETIRILIRTIAIGFTLAVLWTLAGDPVIQQDSTMCNEISICGVMLIVVLFTDLMRIL